MFTLNTKQKIYQIGKYKVGGQPGQLPILLVGNIFYKGMPEVTNHKQGNFHREKVIKWIKLADAFSEKSGILHFLDIMAMYPEAISKYINFTSEQTDKPFLIDGANLETRVKALTTVEQLGLQEHVIFNGITPKTSQKELEALQNSGVNAAVLMVYNEYDYSPEGRISLLKGSTEQLGLLDMARKAGVEKTFMDTVVFDVPSISYAAAAIKLVKEELGEPAGCSPANATYDWKQGLKGSILSEGFAASNASAHTIAQCWGADFLIYGPVKQAKNMITACAVNDAIIAYYAMKNFRIKPMVKSHPLYKIF